MPVTELTTSSHSNELRDAAKDTLVVIDYYTAWCGPCKKLAPELVKLSEEHKKVKFFKIDVEKNPPNDVSITAFPTVVFYKRQKEVARVIGFKLDEITRLVAKHA